MSTISGKPVNLPSGVSVPDTTGTGATTATTTAGLTPTGAPPAKPGLPGDSFTTGDTLLTLGPGLGLAPGEIENEIADKVFKPAGLPNPYNGNTFPALERRLSTEPSFKAAVDATRAYLQAPSSAGAAAIRTTLAAMPLYGNTMETLLAVIKASIQDANDDKRYYLHKLQGFNKIADKLADQLEYMANKSSELAQKEKGAKHPDKEMVQLDNLMLYDTKTLGPDGEPVPSEHISEGVNRSSMGMRMKEIESQQESVRNERQMAQTAFQAVDQRVNQLYQIMAQVSKTMNEERIAAPRNML